jgi:hypothetical protein
MKKILSALFCLLIAANVYGAGFTDYDETTNPADTYVIVIEDPTVKTYYMTVANMKTELGDTFYTETEVDNLLATLSATTVTASGAVTGGTVTDGTITLTGLGTITGLSEGGLPDDTILEADLKAVDAASDEDILTYESTTGDFEWHSAAQVKAAMSLDNVENTAVSTWAGSANITTLGTISSGTWDGTDITAGELSSALTFADGDQLDFTAVTYVNAAATNEGIAIPTYVAGAAPADNKPYLAYDATNNRIMVYESGGWADTSSGSGASADSNYLTTTVDGGLTSESVFAPGYGLIGNDVGGDGGDYELVFDATQIGADDGAETWSDGSQASVAWTFDISGADDPVLTFSDGQVAIDDTLAIGADAADAGAIRLSNAEYIYAEAAPAGTDISVIGVDSSEVIQIGANGAWGVTVTPAATFSGGIADTGTVSAGTWNGTAIAHEYGGVEADVSAYSGLLGVSGGSTTEVDTAAELESFAGLGAFANEYLDDANAAAVRTTLGLAIGTDVLAPDGDGSSLTGLFSEVSEDTTPQLGGDLDVGANEITSTGDVVVELSDNAGSSVFEVEDSDGTAVFSLNSDGELSLTGADGSRYLGLDNNSTGSQPAAGTVVAGMYSYESDLYFLANSKVMGYLDSATGDLFLQGTTDDSNMYQFDLDDPTDTRVITLGDNNIDFSAVDEDYVLKYNAVTDTWAGEADDTGSALGTNLTSAADSIESDTGTIDLQSSTGTSVSLNLGTDGTNGILITANDDGDLTILGQGDGNNEDLNFNFDDDENVVSITSNTEVATVDFGDIGLATDSFDVSEGNITNVGNVALDSITADGTNVLFGTDAATQLQFRDTDLHVASATDGHLDLTADTSIDLNSPTVNFAAGTNTDMTLAFPGTDNSGEFKWMEDEDYFQFSDAVVFDLAVTASGDVSVGDDVLLADGSVVGITGAEIITFDGTANAINFSGATVDVDGAFTATSVTADAAVVAATEVQVGSSNADPSATAGALRHDSTVSNFTNGALTYYNGAAIKQVVDMTTATASACTDDQVVAYDADADLWYCKADAGGVETNSLEIVATGIAAGEIPIGTDTDTITYVSSEALTINMATTGTIMGAINRVDVDSTDADDSYTLSTAQGYGTYLTNYGDDNALTVVLPDVVDGMSVCIAHYAAFAITIDPNGTERIVGDTDTNGDYVAGDGTLGDFYCLVGISATEWMPMGQKGDWTQE